VDNIRDEWLKTMRHAELSSDPSDCGKKIN
ncbi:hypothetical protein JL09_g6784, partial [Pichia kudriavzevii]